MQIPLRVCVGELTEQLSERMNLAGHCFRCPVHITPRDAFVQIVPVNQEMGTLGDTSAACLLIDKTA